MAGRKLSVNSGGALQGGSKAGYHGTAMNPHESPYPSRRRPIYGHRGIVATSQILASQAGLEVLRAGGNAVDAIVAAAAAKTVVEPSANGIGGDAFALVWDGNKLHGLNGSGRAPAALTL